MTTMITEVYDAFKSAGADEQEARKAAEALSNHRDDITRLEHLISKQGTETKSEFRLLHWMIGFNLVLSVGTLWKMFSLT